MKGAATGEDLALNSYTREILGLPSGLGWKELLEHRVVVVLGEPGSGKSRELRNQAETQRAGGKFSFFLRLDQLHTQPIKELLPPEEYRSFTTWKLNTGEAFFFLDSVDEAKLVKASDFHVALRRIHNEIETSRTNRSRFIISSRISEWQPETDLHEIRQFLPRPQKGILRVENTAVVEQEDEQTPLVVCIEPLDRVRVDKFARARGVNQPERFIEALDLSYAWEFARRPIDVAELVEYWNSKKRIGSLAELIEQSIKWNLELPNRDIRSDNLLTVELAREGAEYLGATTIFCKKLNFRIPDEMVVTAGLKLEDSLPEDWTKQQIHSLLERPLFDSASYGNIRFHTRRAAEYLAASWLRRCVNNGCTTEELGGLLFEPSKGKRVLRRAFAPMVAWLCIGDQSWNKDLRKWILDSAPEIHLQYGDPKGLPSEYRLQILKTLVEKYKDRERTWIDWTPESMSRIADPMMSQYVSSIVVDSRVSYDIRRLMLLIIRHGRMLNCLPTALDIIASSTEDTRLKLYAAYAIRDVGDDTYLRKLAQIVKQLPMIPNPLCSTICEAIYPQVINTSDLIEILKKIDKDEENISAVTYYLDIHFRENIPQDMCVDLLSNLLELGQQPPHLTIGSEVVDVSATYSWIGTLVPTLASRILSKETLVDNEVELIGNALWFMGQVHHCDPINTQIIDSLNRLVNEKPPVRRAHFWKLVQEWRKRKKKEPESTWELYDYYEIVKSVPDDLDWLLDEIENNISLRDSELALKLSLELLDKSSKKSQYRQSIRLAALGKSSLKSIYSKWTKDTR